MVSNPGYQKKRRRSDSRRHIRDPIETVEPKHHCGSVRVTSENEKRSSPRLVVDRLGHVGRLQVLGGRIVLARDPELGSPRVGGSGGTVARDAGQDLEMS